MIATTSANRRSQEVGGLSIAKNKKKWITVVSCIVFLLGGIAFYYHERYDTYHTEYRRDWKNNAIREILKDMENPLHFVERFGSQPAPRSFFDTSGLESWHRANTIICADGSWLIFRNRCHKEDAKIHDIFIAYASDKKWYYSDYHFCIGAIILGMKGQSATLEEFRAEFCLESFDGMSDDALDLTIET